MKTSTGDWDHTKIIAVAAVLFIIVMGIVWWWWKSAKKVPRCDLMSWWPKKALGKKAIKSAIDVIEYYKDTPGDTQSGFGLPAYMYWRTSTGGDYRTWIYTQMVVAYFEEGGVETPIDWPPCVFDIEGDCPACIELRTLRDMLDMAITNKPEMGTPKL